MLPECTKMRVFRCNFANFSRGHAPGPPRIVVPSALPLKLISDVTRLWRNLDPPRKFSAYTTGRRPHTFTLDFGSFVGASEGQGGMFVAAGLGLTWGIDWEWSEFKSKKKLRKMFYFIWLGIYSSLQTNVSKKLYSDSTKSWLDSHSKGLWLDKYDSATSLLIGTKNPSAHHGKISMRFDNAVKQKDLHLGERIVNPPLGHFCQSSTQLRWLCVSTYIHWSLRDSLFMALFIAHGMIHCSRRDLVFVGNSVARCVIH